MVDLSGQYYEPLYPLEILFDDIIPDEDYLSYGIATGIFAYSTVLNVEVVPSVVSEVRVLLYNNTGENVFLETHICSAYAIAMMQAHGTQKSLSHT